ncbi:MAG: transposase, partial [Nanoarchaeota archaeon]
MRLTESEIRARLLRLRNLEGLHAQARNRIVFLEKENKELRQRVMELEESDRDKDQKIEALSFQFEQIKNKLFGKKPMAHSILKRKERTPRDIFSYQRPIPEKVTGTEFHPVSTCVHCHGVLQRKSVTVFFEEDIPLPVQKTVTKHEVEIGYCTACRRQSSGYHVPSKKVVLGGNVQKYVCMLSIANRLSHAQIQGHLKAVCNLHISIGEIGNILEEEANHLRPPYQALKESVTTQTGTHYDETGWKVEKEE